MFVLAIVAAVMAVAPSTCQSDVVATVTGSQSTVVDYDGSEWRFSDPVTGGYVAVADPQCAASEDSCKATYADGVWTVERVTP